MPEDEIPVSTQPPASEQAIRAVLRKQARTLSRVLLTPECHRMIETVIYNQTGILQWLQREARRRKPSKPYLRFCRGLVLEAAKPLGPLARLTPNQLATLDQVMHGVLQSMGGRNPIPGSLDGKAFVSLQKVFFVPPRKRGPKNRRKYDEAFSRHLNGEEVSSIARELEPEAYERDPVNTLQRYCHAFNRRRRMLRTSK